MGSIFSSGLRDQHFGENGAQGSKLRQENRDQWVPDIPCYDPVVTSNTLSNLRLLLVINIILTCIFCLHLKSKLVAILDDKDKLWFY